MVLADMPCAKCRLKGESDGHEEGEVPWETMLVYSKTAGNVAKPTTQKVVNELNEKRVIVVTEQGNGSRLYSSVNANDKSLKTTSKAKEKVTCDVCKKTMQRSSLQSHKLKHGDKRFFCDLCCAGFSYKCSLRYHLKNHGKDKLYTNTNCHICSKECSTLGTMRDHLNAEHGISWERGYSGFACPECYKPFMEVFQLKLHLRLYHNQELPVLTRARPTRRYECHVCKQVMKSEHGARKHMRETHNLSNNQMESLKQACEVCGKMFSVKQNLVNHINSAHLNIKPMSCDVCGERFGKHSSLIFHRLRHTGEKPFQCSHCMKTYRQRNDAMRHLARHVRDKEVIYDEAYAINTSSSKFLSKRFVYLRDSTIKGLLDTAMCKAVPKKKKVSQKSVTTYIFMPAEGDGNNETMYEEVVLPEGATLVNNDGDDDDVRYVVAEDSDYLQQDEEDEEAEDADPVEYVLAEEDQLIVNSPGGSQYIMNENEAGEQYLVKVEPVKTQVN